MTDKVMTRAEVVDVKESGRGKYTIDIAIGPHKQVADEPRESGGDDAGPRPHEFVLAASALARP